MTMTRLCLCLLPAAAAVTSASVRRGFLNAGQHHMTSTTNNRNNDDGDNNNNNDGSLYRHVPWTTRRAVYPSFGWTSQAAEATCGGSRSRSNQLHRSTAEAATAREGGLRELATASPALLASVVAVASDVDGTLTRSDSTVSRRTHDAIKAVMDSGLLFFPATGKTRAGVYKILGEEISSELKARNAPGVFIQGLVVYSDAGDEVLFERLLGADIVTQVEAFCEENGVSVIAYSGDRIVCSKNDHQTDKITDYMEPMPQAVGSLTKAMAAGLPVHKLILMDTKEAIERLRPVLEASVGEKATLTQALPDMLEVLPLGASKGNGVEVLLKHLGINPLQLMALGDAENDVDMLLLAGVGICVGNASPPAKLAAQFIAPTNAEDGAAVAMERLHSSRGASKEP